MKTLCLYPEIENAPLEIIDLLGNDIGLFADNSGDSDGNALLPSAPVICDKIVEAGYGEYINAAFLSSSEIAQMLKIKDALWLAENTITDDWEVFVHAVEEKVTLWAHFGAYGAGDEIWVCAKVVSRERKHG